MYQNFVLTLYRNKIIKSIMGTFRITYRREILINANSQEEAEEIFEGMDELELHNQSEFVEQTSIDEDN